MAPWYEKTEHATPRVFDPTEFNDSAKTIVLSNLWQKNKFNLQGHQWIQLLSSPEGHLVYCCHIETETAVLLWRKEYKSPEGHGHSISFCSAENLGVIVEKTSEDNFNLQFYKDGEQVDKLNFLPLFYTHIRYDPIGDIPDHVTEYNYVDPLRKYLPDPDLIVYWLGFVAWGIDFWQIEEFETEWEEMEKNPFEEVCKLFAEAKVPIFSFTKQTAKSARK